MMSNEFNSKEYRDAFVEAMIRNGLAFQIRALRDENEWTQGDLAGRIGTRQNVISRYEDPDYGNFSLRTLRRLASEFDVALVCRFATFSELRRIAADVSEDSVAVLSYDQELELAAQVSAITKASRKVISISSVIAGKMISAPKQSAASDNTADYWWQSDGALLAAETQSRDRISPKKVSFGASDSEALFAASHDSTR